MSASSSSWRSRSRSAAAQGSYSHCIGSYVSQASRSRSFKLLSLLFAFLFAGCQWSRSTLEGNEDAEIDIPSLDITKILSVTQQLMLTNGYQATPGANNQEVPFVAAHSDGQNNWVLCFSNRGQDRVWIIAEPIGCGWHLYCLPEPQVYDTSFTRRRFQRILQSVRDMCR